MRIATYNIWNHGTMDIRYPQIPRALNAPGADVIALQEVAPDVFARLRGDLAAYSHAEYAKYPDCEEGLAILSRYPLTDVVRLAGDSDYGYSQAISAVVQAEGRAVSITNVHLPWDSILEKERQITRIERFIRGVSADAHVLLGDFNCGLHSSVHMFLLGEQSLLGCEANPYWCDLASAHFALSGEPNRPTLDFQTNPRWGGKNTNYIPDVLDRILVRDGLDSRWTLRDAKIFGTEVSDETGYAPSDHYGVVARVDFG